MSRPIVAIVGRPNVGKSTLFNKLIGQRLSIVEDTPGVTRDRIFGECEWKNRKFSLVDTGGIEPESKDIILSQMRTQAQIAIDSADCIIFVTDVRTGMVATDLNIAQMLQRSNVPVIVCVNKCDTLGDPPEDFYEFYNLGLGDPIQVSSVHGHGTGDLLDAVLEHLPEEKEEEDEGEIIKVGRHRQAERRQIFPCEPRFRRKPLHRFQHCGYDARRGGYHHRKQVRRIYVHRYCRPAPQEQGGGFH